LAFQPEEHGLDEYKKKLHRHVADALGDKLCAKLSTETATSIENIQQEMAGNK
jgi:hypothetical protein